MSSTVTAAEMGPIDLGHLARMTCGEKALEREVLEMFLKQSDRLVSALSDTPEAAVDLSHALKGSARAIGAFGVADLAANVEDAACWERDLTLPLADLKRALAEARDAIEALLRRP